VNLALFTAIDFSKEDTVRPIVNRRHIVEHFEEWLEREKGHKIGIKSKLML